MRELVRNFSKDLLQSVILPGSFLWRLPSAAGLALTFDDGPDPEFTPPLLDLLREHGVAASFFLIGSKVRRHPRLAARIVAEGHTVGGHGYDHEVITSMSHARLGEDLERCRATIREATGVDTRLFRPPKGKVNVGSIRSVHVHGYRMVHWSRTYGDYRRDGVEALLQRMKRDLPRSGEIVLLHDNNSFTIDVLAQSLPEWKSMPLAFAKL